MNDRLPPIPFRPTLPELLHRAVERFGESDFVVMIDRRTSFAGAERGSAAFARQLLAAGVGKGTRVGIILPTGIDWLVAWLAAARIGALPMLFPSTYRPAELRRALRMSDAAILVATTTMLGKDYERFLEESVPSLVGHDARPLHAAAVPFLRSIWLFGEPTRAWAGRVTTDADKGAGADTGVTDELFAAVEAEVGPDDPLLVIYTSGSSADPKAVVHTHGAAIRKVQPELGLSLPGSFPGRTFCAMPFFWVGGPQDLLGALHSGAAVVTQERFDATEALELLERERCTSVLGWASVLEQIRAEPGYERRDLHALTSAAPREPVVSTRGDPPNLGMTETFGPHANRTWFDYKIVDPTTGTRLPDGDIGEFCVRGFGLMAGMYKREREDVFDADGWYHTGDRGYVEDGRIWFTGRYSEMIKSSGTNVSPLEVEHVLEAFPDVKTALVVGVTDAQGGEAVAAVVVAANQERIAPEDLRARLNRELSAYKVPKHWLVLPEDEVPLLASGKADKRALRSRMEANLATESPGGPTIQTVG
jgi:acyl-CoA synthetase (AMP-forming)/AMP-acid ligase II